MNEKEIVEKIKERINEETKKGKQYGRMKAAREFGIDETTARRFVDIAKGLSDVPMQKLSSIKPIVSVSKGLTIDQIRSKHDNLFIARKKVLQLKKDLFLTQPEFLSSCNFANTNYRNTIEQPEFSQYKGKAGSIIYWSHPDSIKQLKDESVLKDC